MDKSTIFFTSITPNYIAKARVLCKTLKRHNPNFYFVLGIVGSSEMDDKYLFEPFDDVLKFESLDQINNKKSFMFKHNVSELCTALKPIYALTLFSKYKAEKIIYLDPDIAVFNSLSPLLLLLEKYSILLTPHQLAPENEDEYVKRNEILFLKKGSFNLGFFGVKNDKQGKDFLNWWKERLKSYCFDDNYEVLPELSKNHLLGLFTDQKWIDLVPSFFPNYHIIRDPGYNVCTWNLSNRNVRISADGSFSVNGFPLRFFHFSGYDNRGHHNELRKSLKYYPNNQQVLKISKWYEEQLANEGQDYFGNISFQKSKYDNGVIIQDFERKIYHIRKDIQRNFRNPYKVSLNEPCFYYWIRKEYEKYFNKSLSPEEVSLGFFSENYRNNSLQQKVAELQEEVLFYSLSKSWRLTRPLRKLFTIFRKKTDM